MPKTSYKSLFFLKKVLSNAEASFSIKPVFNSNKLGSSLRCDVSIAAYTTRFICASRMAPVHIMQGSKVIYSVHLSKYLLPK